MADNAEVFGQVRHLLAQLRERHDEYRCKKLVNWGSSLESARKEVKNSDVWPLGFVGTRGESQDLFYPVPEFNELKKVAAQHWRIILENIEEIAPSENQKMFLLLSLVAMSLDEPFNSDNRSKEMLKRMSTVTMPLEEAFQCQSKIADLCLDKRISKKMYGLIHTCFFMHTNNAPSFNYRHPAVIEFMKKYKTIYADDKEKQKRADEILSGKNKRDLQKHWERYFDDLPQPEILKIKTTKTDKKQRL